MKQIGQKYKITAFLMALCMVLTMLAAGGIAALASDALSYMDYNEQLGEFEEETQSNVTVITADITTLESGWYAADGTVEISNPITVSGDVHLILKDDCTFNCTQGIIVSGDNSLTVYGQSSGTGTMNATGQAGGYPGIGAYSGKIGTVVINGGIINAAGSFVNTVSYPGGVSHIGAGIGGASGNYGSFTTGGSVIINGGQVTANGGSGWSSGYDRSAHGILAESFSTGQRNAFIKTNNGISDKSRQTAWSGIIFEGNSGTVYGDQTLAVNLEIDSNRTLTVSAGAKLTVPNGVTLTNLGTLNLSGGDMVYTGDLTNSGTLNVETGRILSVTGALINSGAATIDGTADCGSIQNSGTIHINGGFTCNGGSNTGLIYNTGTLTNTGTISGENGYVVSTTPVAGVGNQLLSGDTLFYLDENGAKKYLSSDDSIYPLSAADHTWKKQDGKNTWYVVTKDLTIDDGTKLEDDVNLLLMDDVTLTVNGRNDNGGINAADHTLNIYAQSCGDGMGKLVVTGGHYNWMAIGGLNANINIYGGFIEAGLTGEYYSGIGPGIYQNFGKINVTGGVIKTSSIGTIKVGDMTGGIFAPEGSSAVIYTKQTNVDTSKISGFNGIIFLQKSGSVYGDADLAMDLTVESDETLTITKGTTLTVPEGITLTVNGKLIIEGTLVLNGTLENSGTIEDNGNHDFVKKQCRFCGAEGYNQGMTVTYSVAPTYTVTIPETVTLGETATVKAENVVVEKGKQVEVKLSGTSGTGNAFTLKTAEGAEIDYTVKRNGSAVSLNNTVLTVNPSLSDFGSVELNFEKPSNITYAGNYTGTVTFTVSIENE